MKCHREDVVIIFVRENWFSNSTDRETSQAVNPIFHGPKVIDNGDNEAVADNKHQTASLRLLHKFHILEILLPFQKNSISGVSRTQPQSLRLSVRRPVVVTMVNSNGRAERNVGVSVDSAIKDVNAPVAVEVADSDSEKPTAAVGGGVEDVYGEDTATEDHFITPWSVSVASGYSFLRDSHHNKGLAFTEKERCSLFTWSSSTGCCQSRSSGKKMMDLQSRHAHVGVDSMLYACTAATQKAWLLIIMNG